MKQTEECTGDRRTSKTTPKENRSSRRGRDINTQDKEGRMTYDSNKARNTANELERKGRTSRNEMTETRQK